MIKSKYKIGDCLFWISLSNEKYVFEIVDIYKDLAHKDYREIVYHKFKIVYGKASIVPTRAFQDDSNVYNTSKLLPKDWDEVDLMTLVI